MSSLKNKIKALIPDPIYISMVYYHHFHKFLNLRHPKTLNEKIQWLKLHDRRPEYSTMVDKITAKEYAARIIGEEHIIPTIGVWDKVEEINYDILPDQFVLKCNHDSGSVVICRNKAEFNKSAAAVKLSKGLKRSGYLYGREWPYKSVRPRIMAEEYINDSADSDELTDYKFYCFDGIAHCVLCCYERKTGSPKFYFFDRDWNLKRYNKRGKEAPKNFTMPKPERMDEMFDMAELLAKEIKAPFIRVDLYNANGQIYFGELTLYPSSGFDENRLPETDLMFGEMVKLPID